MTNKDNLQKELQEKIKEGVKPSHLRKSKSLDNIPTSSLPISTPLQKSQSQLAIPVLVEPSPEQQISQLQEQVKFHAQTSQNYLQSLQAAQAKIIELEELPAQIKQLEQHILELRLDKIKEFGDYYEQKQALTQELDDNINTGTQEIQRLENKLLTVNKKKLELQQQLGQSQSKNAQLELKLLNKQKPNTFNYWPMLTVLALGCLSFWLFSQTNQKQE